MLKLRWALRSSLAALALCTAVPAFAQSTGGLGAKLDAAEKKLDEDIKACRPINVEEYRQLFTEAYRNFKTFMKLAQSGVPVDPEVIKSDHKRAEALVDRAKAAAAKPCPPPQKAAPPEKKVEPPKAETPLAGGQLVRIVRDPFWKFADEADDAMNYLDWAMASCNEDKVKELIPKLEEMAKKAHELAEAAKAAGKFSKVDPADADELADDLDEAVADAKAFKCPKKPPPEKPKSGISYEPDPFAMRILYIHNEERAAVHVPALKWNPQLALDATAWAHQLARTHQLVHAPREGRGIERENLLQARIGWSPYRMMQSWTMEKRDFVSGYYPNVARDGNWLNVSHYSQMIWPTTTDIGCGEAAGGGFEWVVCRYSPGGNKDGQPVGLRRYPERG